jgi:WD40 repeat protein
VTADSAAFNRDGTMLATGAGNGTTYLWNVASMTPQGEPLVDRDEKEPQPIRGLAFSHDDAWLATGDGSGTITIWEMASGVPRRAPLLRHARGIRSLAFSPDNHILASGGEDGLVVLWDTDNQLSLEPPLAEDTTMRTAWYVAFDADGRLLTFATSSREVKRWDTRLTTWMEHACTIANRTMNDDEWWRYVGRAADETMCSSLPAGPSSATAPPAPATSEEES